MTRSKGEEALIDFTAGSIAGIACVYVGQPLDTVKVKMQTSSKLYKSSLACTFHTFHKEGIRGFYAGTTPAVVANVAENSCLFLFYGQCRNFVQYMSDIEKKDLTSFHGACAGSLASFFTAFALCPPEIIKCRLQIARQHDAVLKATPFTLIKEILKQDGALGFYRGMTSLLIREIPANFFFFGGYEGTKSLLLKTEEEKLNPAVWKIILAGGLGGVSYWLSIYPSDVIKSKLQVQHGKSSSIIETARTMFKQEGIASFYRGLGPTLLRAFPANATLFFVYEWSKKTLSELSA